MLRSCVQWLPCCRGADRGEEGSPASDASDTLSAYRQRSGDAPRRQRSVRARFATVNSSAAGLLRRLPTGLKDEDEDGHAWKSRKILYLVRHAEAQHNVKEIEAQAEAKRNGCTESEIEEARKRVLKDPAFLDACLSSNGRLQVQTAEKSFQELLSSTHYVVPEVVLVSPLTRTLQTASVLFPDHGNVRAMEFLRERRTGESCDERKPACEIEADFPHVEMGDVAAKDRAGPDGHTFRAALREGNEQVAVRAAQLLDVVREQAGKAVAVVTHKGFLRELNKGPLKEALEQEGSQLPTLFGNAEVRVCEVAWDEHGHLEEVIARTLKEVAEAPPMELLHQNSWRGGDAATSSWTVGLRGMRRLISGGDPLIEDLADVTGGGLCAAVGTSAEDGSGSPAEGGSEPARAAATAWRAMEDRLGGPPSVALVFCDQALEGAEVARALRPMAGAAFVVGGSSCGGVFAAGGPRTVGVLGLRNFAHRCSVGSVEDITDGHARKRAAQAVTKAAGGVAPHMVLVCSAPGCEEDILAGINDALGSAVPVFGWSSGGSQVDEPQEQHWWQLVGSMAGWRSFSNGAVFACLWVFADSRVSSLLSHCFAPTEHKGRITKTDGRFIVEIERVLNDGTGCERVERLPAATVLNEWTGGALQSKLLAGGSVMREGRIHPLAIRDREASAPRLACMRAVHEGGHVSCFCAVPCGECRMMCLKATDLKGALQAAIQESLKKEDFAVRGALISVDAGCIADAQVLREVLPEVPEVLCCFPFGQQGMIGETARHGNLMISVLLFG